MGKLNIAEFLKDCPKDMELDCLIYEDVYFDYVDELNIIHCYIQHETHKTSLTFNQHGTPNSDIKSKCVIFPKGKTTWEGFQKPFKDGDILTYTNNHTTTFIYRKKDNEPNFSTSFYVACNNALSNNFLIYNKYALIALNGNCDVRLATEEEKQKLFDAIKANGYKWNQETKTLEKLIAPWTVKNAKDGDVICYDDGWTCIFKNIHGIWFSSYCFITDDGEFHTGYEWHAVDSTIRGNAHRATKEQCDRLFQKIKEAGYKWNPETKTLEKLVEPKFKVGDKIKEKTDKFPSQRTINHYVEGIGYFTTIHDCVRIEDQDKWELVPNKFDINTLKPFESRVLVRDYDYQCWSVSFFGYFDKFMGKFDTVRGVYIQCIPYEGNEHLLSTNKDCDNYYKNWE